MSNMQKSLYYSSEKFSRYFRTVHQFAGAAENAVHLLLSGAIYFLYQRENLCAVHKTTLSV